MHVQGVEGRPRWSVSEMGVSALGTSCSVKSDLPITWVWLSNSFEGLLWTSRTRCSESRAAAARSLTTTRAAREASASFSEISVAPISRKRTVKL